MVADEPREGRRPVLGRLVVRGVTELAYEVEVVHVHRL